MAFPARRAMPNPAHFDESEPRALWVLAVEAWLSGSDTKAIADRFHMEEARIANLIARYQDRAAMSGAKVHRVARDTSSVTQVRSPSHTEAAR